MRYNPSKLEYLDTLLLIFLTAFTEHAVFPMRPIFAWATVVLFVVIVALKLRSKVSRYIQALTQVNKREVHRDLVSNLSLPPLGDCPLVLALPASVTRSDVDFIDRAAWVQRMTHHVFSERHRGSHNVLVINDKLEYQLNAHGILERFLITYHSQSRAGNVRYAVVVFREGTLVNMGDGGDINWDWQGNFTRSGNKVLAFKPCVPGVVYKHDPWVAR